MDNIIVVSGPSGSGKSTLIHLLLQEHKELSFSISYTSRKKRKSEKNGEDYYFISKDKFKKMIDAGKFVEWVEIHSNYYGTSRDEIDLKLKNDKILILDVDAQGAKNIKKFISNALFIFVVPPTLKDLKKRLIKRENDKINKDIRKRLKIAKKELEQYELYDYIVTNDKLDDAFSLLNCIYLSFLNSTRRKKVYLEEIIGQK